MAAQIQANQSSAAAPETFYLPEVLTGERLYEISLGLDAGTLYRIRVAGSGLLVFNDYPLAINTGTRQVLSGEQAVPSTKLEFDMVTFLANNADNTMSRDEILEAVWGAGQPYVGDTHVVDVHNSNFKRRFYKALAERRVPYPIRSVRSVGFVFMSKPQEEK